LIRHGQYAKGNDDDVDLGTSLRFERHRYTVITVNYGKLLSP